MRPTANNDRYRFVATLANALPKLPPHRVAMLAELIMRNARTIDGHAVNQCNRTTTDRENERCRSAASRILAALAEEAPGILPTFGGDPRGYVVKLKFPNGAHNTMGGPEDGYGVPVGN